MVYTALLSELEKETAVGGKFVAFVFILSVVRISDKDGVVQEPPGVGGGYNFSHIVLGLMETVEF